MTGHVQMISVLYVDDEPDLLSVGKSILELSGEFTVETCTSARDALEAISLRSFDAIVSDYQMKGLDGIGLLKLVRERYGDIPFILFTGRGREEVVIEAINNGADFYLQKGGNVEAQFAELKHKIRHAVRRKHAEESLRDSERRLADIIDFLPDPTFAVDNSGHVIAWNRAMEEMTKIPSQRILGKSDYEYALPLYGKRRPLLLDLIYESDERITGQYTIISRSGTTITAETDLPRPDGSVLSVYVKACPLYNQEGEVTGAIESVRDITEIKRIEEDKKRFGSILDNSSNEIFTVDAQSFHFIDVNQRSRENLGYSLEEMRRLTPLDIYPGFSGQSFQDLISPLLEGKTEKILFTTVHKRKDGTVYPVEEHLQRSMRDQQKVIVFIGLDITEREKTFTALNESESRFRLFIENTFESVVLVDEDGIIFEWNPGSELLTGISKDEAIGQKIWDIIVRTLPTAQKTRQVCESLQQQFRETLHTGIPFMKKPWIMEIEHLDGRQIFAREAMFAITTRKGFGICVISQDISDEIHAQRTLKESEERFRGMAERTSDLILILDDSMSYSYISPSSRLILGFDPDELSGCSSDLLAQRIFPKSWTVYADAVRDVMRGATVSDVELSVTKKDGTEAEVSMHAVPVISDGSVSGAQISMHDITAIKKSETALHEIEDKFHRFSDNARDMLYRMSIPDGRFEYISPASMPLTGYSPEDYYSNPELVQSLIHPAWREYFTEKWNELLQNIVSPTYEYQIIDRSGHIRWFNQRNMVISDRDGNPAYIEGIVTDITERKNIERELRMSEQRFLSVTLNAGSWIWEINTEGVFTYTSPAVEQILGYRPDELVGKVRYFDLFDPKEREKCEENAFQFSHENRPFRNVIMILKHRDHRRVILRTSGMPGFDEDGAFTGFSGVNEDITREKEYEEALVQLNEELEKRVLVRTNEATMAQEAYKQANMKLNLLSGITRHDILNQVTGLLGYLDFALDKVTDDEVRIFLIKCQAIVETIEDQIGFTKVYEDIGTRSPTWQSVECLLQITRRNLKNSNLEYYPDITGLMIYADPLLEKVFFTLVENTIRHGQWATQVKISYLPDNSDLILVYEDNGVGVAAEDKQKIFKRGFGKNTGLGLFISREILLITDLSVSERGAAGSGVRFEIRIPEGKFRFQEVTHS